MVSNIDDVLQRGSALKGKTNFCHFISDGMGAFSITINLHFFTTLLFLFIFATVVDIFVM